MRQQLEERHNALARLAPQLPDRLDALRTEQEISQLHEQISTATMELDQALHQAAKALRPLSFKLARTRHRGVYHADHRYIVPYSDDFGRDRHREFDTLQAKPTTSKQPSNSTNRHEFGPRLFARADGGLTWWPG